MSDLVRLFPLSDGDGISLIFLDMNLNTSTSQGRHLRHVMGAFAEYESDIKLDYARMTYPARNRVRADPGWPRTARYKRVGKRYEVGLEVAASSENPQALLRRNPNTHLQETKLSPNVALGSPVVQQIANFGG